MSCFVAHPCSLHMVFVDRADMGAFLLCLHVFGDWLSLPFHEGTGFKKKNERKNTYCLPRPQHAARCARTRSAGYYAHAGEEQWRCKALAFKKKYPRKKAQTVLGNGYTKAGEVKQPHGKWIGGPLCLFW